MHFIEHVKVMQASADSNFNMTQYLKIIIMIIVSMANEQVPTKSTIVLPLTSITVCQTSCKYPNCIVENAEEKKM